MFQVPSVEPPEAAALRETVAAVCRAWIALADGRGMFDAFEQLDAAARTAHAALGTTAARWCGTDVSRLGLMQDLYQFVSIAGQPVVADMNAAAVGFDRNLEARVAQSLRLAALLLDRIMGSRSAADWRRLRIRRDPSGTIN
jgi:hypothetical protein